VPHGRDLIIQALVQHARNWDFERRHFHPRHDPRGIPHPPLEPGAANPLARQ
jgi:hypothetical protein